MDSTAGWRELGAVAPGELEDTRRQLHWAAQVTAAFTAGRLEPRDDFGHLALEVEPDGRLVTDAAPDGTRLGLRLAMGTLELEGAGARASFGLEGRTLAEALAWLDAGLAAGGAPLSIDPADMPDHPVAANEPFRLDAAAAAELERWYLSLATVLADVRREHAGASPLRLWPHHFDLATLIALDPPERGEDARSVGVGFSPGDPSYDEPYLYVTPAPPPPDEDLPPLEAGGRWHVEGWTGATLSSLRIVTAGDAREQERQVRDFLASALPAALGLLA